MPDGASYELEEAQSADDPQEFAREVAAGLAHEDKQLPCRYLYDAEGSRIFEEICKQPEYYPTRAEKEILLERGEEILEGLGQRFELVELGSGNSEKTHHLLATACRIADSVTYVPVDICKEIIEEAAVALHAEMPELEIRGLAAEYDEALQKLHAGDLTEDHGPRMILWLGSNLGNLSRGDAADFLARVGRSLRPEDRILLGVDLRKDKDVLEAAYDDSAGVTASFSKNMLTRINRELEANFDLEHFEHVAEYDIEDGVVRIYLESQKEQTVHISELQRDVQFAEGERIHTEVSNKYSLEEIHLLAEKSGLAVERTWYDGKGLYSLHRLYLRSSD